jgi:hypothetical protein
LPSGESKTRDRKRRRTKEQTRRTRNNIMNLEEWYFQTPIVTRCYLTMSFLITAGCALEVRF